MRKLLSSCVLLLTMLCAGPSRAYTPESGTWWNPAEPGTGIFIEVQDNFLVAAAYVYDSFGNATWFTATGFLTGNARFVGQLDAFVGGQCIGCPWRPNSDRLGAGGQIQIDFNPTDPTKATLTWGGRVRPIERFHFYLKRPEDGNRSIQLTKMLGEWQFVLDFTTLVSNFPYYGELLVFERLDLGGSTPLFTGCRGDNSVNGFCSNAALRDHDAAGFYDSAKREHVIVVEDSPTTFAMYVLRVGTNHAQGEFSVYTRGTNPRTFAPVRGFRSASRTFVEEGVGPSKAAVQTAVRPGIGETLDLASFAPVAVGPQHSEIPYQRLLEIAKQLEAQLTAN